MQPAIKLSKEESTERGRMLTRLIEQDMRDRRGTANRRARVRRLYYGEEARPTRRPGQSDIHLAVLTEKIEGTVPKISNAFFGADPVIHTKHVAQEKVPERTDIVERMMNWAVESGIPDFYETFITWVRNMLLDSVSYLKQWYRYETAPSLVIESVKVIWRPGEIDFNAQEVRLMRKRTPLEVLVGIFGSNLPNKGITRLEALSRFDGDEGYDVSEEQEDLVGLAFELDIVDGRVPFRGVRVEFHACKYIDEISVYVFRPVVTADRVEAQVIEWEDMILPYRAKSLQTCERVTQQYWLTLIDLERLIDEDGWDISPEELERLKAQLHSAPQEESEENDQLKRQKDGVQGVTDSQTGQHALEPFSSNKVLIFEVYCRDRLVPGGPVHELVYHIPYTLERVVRAYYLEELYPHRRRPYATWRYTTVGDRWDGISMADLLAPINLEVDAIINLVNDGQEIINTPWFIYEPTAMTVDPSVFASIEPGQGIPVASVDGIKFPAFPEQPLANLSALDSLLMFADRLTLSPQSVGSSQVRNSPRTARGTLALLSEAGVKNDMIIEQGQRGGWREMCHQMHALWEHFGPEELWINVTGESKPVCVKRGDLVGRFEFSFSGNSVNTNREVKRSIAQLRYNTLSADPLFATDLNARLELVKDFLRHADEGADVTKLLPRLPGQGAPHLPYSQAQELEMLTAGIPVEVLPTDNHVEHLQEIERFQRTPRFNELGQAEVVLLAWHKKQHMQQMIQQQASGGVAVPGGTQSNNVPTDINQAMSALEGGVQ